MEIHSVVLDLSCVQMGRSLLTFRRWI